VGKPKPTGTDRECESKTVNNKLKIREIVIVRSRMTKQSKFTLVGLLHFVHNDTVYIPLPSVPSRLWRESYYMIYIFHYYFLALDGRGLR
jgi:hypothetical protein